MNFPVKPDGRTSKLNGTPVEPQNDANVWCNKTEMSDK